MLSNYVSYLFRPSANQIEHFLRQKTKNLHLIHLVKVVNKKKQEHTNENNKNGIKSTYCTTTTEKEILKTA